MRFLLTRFAKEITGVNGPSRAFGNWLSSIQRVRLASRISSVIYCAVDRLYTFNAGAVMECAVASISKGPVVSLIRSDEMRRTLV